MDTNLLYDLAYRAYAFSDQQITELGTNIATAYLTSQQAAYRHASHLARYHTGEQWVPRADLQAEIQDWAQEQARHIATTYHAMLQHLLASLLEEKTQHREERSTKGVLDDLILIGGTLLVSLSRVIGAWLKKLMEWKPQQIARATCGSGADDGTDLFVADVLHGIIEIPMGVKLSVAVVPPESSSDVCQTYAGNIYELSEYENLPGFPIHPNCVHTKMVIQI